MNTIILVISACVLPPDPHWAVGSWQTGFWGGVCLRPDGYVVERDPDGNVTDIGRWSCAGDDGVIFWLIRAPQHEHYLIRRGGAVFFQRDYGNGYISGEEPVRKGHVPAEFDGFVVEAPPPEPILDFPEDWK